jgi:hypothetical protein
VIVDEAGTALTAGDDLPARLNALRPQIEEGMDWLARELDRPNRRPPR